MFDLALAKQFAWISRRDLRKGQSSLSVPNEEFNRWWMVIGRKEYPFWSRLKKADKAFLLEPAGTININKLEMTIPRVMQLILSWRPDVIKVFTRDGKANPLCLAGWFFALGMKEHRFGELVNLDLIRQLDRVAAQDSSEGSRAISDVPSPTVLMVLVWHLLDANMQKSMDLQTPTFRYRYLAWFFALAVNRFGFDNLIANRWRSWLLQEFMIDDNLDHVIPNFALLERSLTDGDKRLDLKNPDAIAQLQAWAARAIEVGGKWHWLKVKSQFSPEEDTPESTVGALSSVSAKRPFGVNLIGFAFGELGLGEDLRMAVACCQEANIPYRVINVPLGKEIRQNDLLLAEELLESGKPLYPVNIYCMPGFDVVGRIFLPKGTGSFENHYNIGWWPWEMSVWPKAWSRAFELADELWTCSLFSQEMYEKSTAKLSSLMPLSASVERVKTYPRKHFGLPEKKYLFLYVFDFSSHLMRKNPFALLDAFEQSFSGDRNVGLVLKIMNSNPEDEAWKQFKKRVEGDKRIYMIEETLDRPEILGLIKACDVYVSPHRAEGFGRTLAEAMLLGKAVVATNYSGNQFFMNPELTFPVDYELVPAKAGDYHFIENEDEAVWAKISVKHLGEQMHAALAVCRKAPFQKSVVAYAKGMFAPRKTGLLMKERLEKVKAELIERGWI